MVKSKSQFAEVAGEKLLGDLFAPTLPPTPILNRVKSST